MTILYFSIISIILTFLITYAMKANSSDSPNRKNVFAFCITIAYFVYIVITVFRPIYQGQGGTDAWHYKNYFELASGSLQNGLSVQFYERGYAVFVWFIRQFTSDYRVLLCIVHSFIFISTTQFLKSIRYNRYSWITVLSLIFLALYSINTIRTILAISIFYWILLLFNKNKVVSPIILALVAISIHISAAIIFPIGLVYLIRKFEVDFDIQKLLRVLVVLIVGAFLIINLVDVFINQTKYVFYDADGGIAFPSYIMFLTVFLMTIIYYEDLTENNPFISLFIYLLPVGLVIFPLQYRYAIMYRMLLYIHPLLYTLIPSLLIVNDKNKDRKVLYYTVKIILLFFVLYRIYGFFTAEIVDLGTFPLH